MPPPITLKQFMLPPLIAVSPARNEWSGPGASSGAGSNGTTSPSHVGPSVTPSAPGNLPYMWSKVRFSLIEEDDVFDLLPGVGDELGTREDGSGYGSKRGPSPGGGDTARLAGALGGVEDPAVPPGSAVQAATTIAIDETIAGPRRRIAGG